MQALTGEKGDSRPGTRHSKASDGAAGEGKEQVAAARNRPLCDTIADVGEGQEETEVKATDEDGQGGEE
jgi:hypothetical protein